MSPITRSITSLHRICNPNFPTYRDLDNAYNFCVPLIRDDAKQYLQRILDVDEIRELYNPISEEYWFVNNIDALNQVVYYKMKRSLYRKYRQQFIKAGVELEFFKRQGSDIGCGKIGCDNINCDGDKLSDDDFGDNKSDLDIFCSNYIRRQDSNISSNFSSFYYDPYDPPDDFATAITTATAAAINNNNFKNYNLNNRFNHNIHYNPYDNHFGDIRDIADIKIRYKKEESSQTILGDYVDSSHYQLSQYSNYSNSRNLRHHHHHHQDDSVQFIKYQFFINLVHKLSKEKKFYYVLIFSIAIIFFGCLLSYRNDNDSNTFSIIVGNNRISGHVINNISSKNSASNKKIYKVLDNGKLDGAVKSQVKEFIEHEMSKIAAGDISSNQHYLSNSVNGDGDENNRLVGLVRKQLNEVGFSFFFVFLILTVVL